MLLAAYAATLGLHAGATGAYSADEAAHLRVAEAATSGAPLGRPPQGIGLGLLIAPARALGGARLAELWLAAIAALGFALAALVARRVVPEPWATAGAALAGLSPPALAHATAIEPWAAGGTLLAGAVACALAVRERPRMLPAAAGGALLALLPWLSPLLIAPALPVAVALARWSRGARGGALLPVEILLGSLVFYATLNRGLYGALLPPESGPPAPPVPDRLPRAIAMWLDRDAGLLRWAPVLALAWWAAWLLWRSRRDGLARALPGRRAVEAAAGLLVAVCAAQLVVAVLAAPGLHAAGFPAGMFVAALPAAGGLCGWGLRRTPRAGALLGALTLAASVWLVVALRTGAALSWDAPPAAPWGPLVAVFPRWDSGSAGELAVTAVVAAAALAVLVREWRARGAG